MAAEKPVLQVLLCSPRGFCAGVVRAIETAPGLGTGHGPLNHGHTVAPFDGR